MPLSLLIKIFSKGEVVENANHAAGGAFAAYGMNNQSYEVQCLWLRRKQTRCQRTFEGAAAMFGLLQDNITRQSIS